MDKDELLLDGLKDGDMHAFDRIYAKYYQPLCAYAYHHVSLTDAEEVVQDVMLWLWENRDELVVRSSLASYLRRAVYLRCLSRIANGQARQRQETIYWQNYVSDAEDDEAETTEEIIERIHAAIDRLPDKFRDAFIKHRLEGMSYKEIAEVEGVSAKTVDYRLRQAMRLLREDLRAVYPLLLLIL